MRRAETRRGEPRSEDTLAIERKEGKAGWDRSWDRAVIGREDGKSRYKPKESAMVCTISEVVS
jgi:hypothetical protein